MLQIYLIYVFLCCSPVPVFGKKNPKKLQKNTLQTANFSFEYGRKIGCRIECVIIHFFLGLFEKQKQANKKTEDFRIEWKKLNAYRNIFEQNLCRYEVDLSLEEIE